MTYYCLSEHDIRGQLERRGYDNPTRQEIGAAFEHHLGDHSRVSEKDNATFWVIPADALQAITDDTLRNQVADLLAPYLIQAR